MKGVMSVGYDINSILGEVLLGGCVAVGAVCSILNSCIRHLVHIGPCEPDLVCRVTSYPSWSLVTSVSLMQRC